MGLNPGIARAYSIPMDELPILEGIASRAITIMYIMRNSRIADITLEMDPNARQKRGYLARRSIVFIPRRDFIMIAGPYFTRWNLSASPDISRPRSRSGCTG